MEEWFLEKYSIIHYSLKAERLSLRIANIVGMLLNLLDVLIVSGTTRTRVASTMPTAAEEVCTMGTVWGH